MNNKEKNYILSKCLISAYAQLGIKHAFVSPGSRNTPLMLALSDQSEIKVYNVIDERSSGYMALGIAKANDKPALLITTSGTAVSNLFPSIVEAYMSSFPMIILTADRPKKLVGTGANQTINQYNIFNNYVKKFIDFSNIKEFNQETIFNIAIDACNRSMEANRGPVHINIPFNTPLYVHNRNKIQFKKNKLSKLESIQDSQDHYKIPNFKKYRTRMVTSNLSNDVFEVLDELISKRDDFVLA